MAWDSLYKDDLLRPRLSSSRSQSSYESPLLSELQRMLWTNRTSTGHVNEVWPHLYLGDAYTARDKAQLSQLGITHILNAADGRFHVNTGPRFYKDMEIDYYGIEADDDPEFNLSIYFYPAARYIRAALNSPKGRIFIHCAMGISRSATLVLAFLMICENMTLVDAIQTVSKHRDISPNSGFLEQLRQLDTTLVSERKMKTAHFNLLGYGKWPVELSHKFPDSEMSTTTVKKRKNAYTAVTVDPDTGYSTPGAFELERLFWQGGAKYTHVNEVWPNLYIGDEKTALDRYNLEKMGFTHILNAAHGRWNVCTGAEYYSDMVIEYYGVEAEDLPSFNLSEFFYPAAKFIDSALNKPENKILVHCAMGRSRSAALVLAYMMIYKNMTVVDAIEQVLKHRCILPNRGFLKQLRQLDIQLAVEKKNAKNNIHSNGGDNGEENI
ncbi:uncharacterized protein LOC115471273 [Microcaecilia unicolor]|uniref:Dual specificity phosphatase 29 n=1 Tax=Microcaecilia unicolor TaxID=1415580 RepID=A0A6P7YCS2_9AMPH|nr:uncharacterized protein LOC115471273 [Microcaecilia unicolor]